mgnify:CR=1 FL=1
MERKLLELTPKRYLCPYCGEWHTWELSHELGYYDSRSYQAKLGCEHQRDGCNQREMSVFFDDDGCHVSTEPTCIRGNLKISTTISINDIAESSDEPRVTFSVPFIASGPVGKSKCSRCESKDECLICELGDKNQSRSMRITFGFEFLQSDYDKFAKSAKKAISEQPQVNKNEEDTTMANNNIFNMNLEFGPNKDENIASTLMGVAVKNGDSWRIYDKKKKEITDIGDMQLGNLPIFILPTTQLSEGDLIKDAGEYYFVIKVEAGSTQTLCAKTGEMKTVIPIKNVLGFSCYSKVIALSDSLNMGDDFDVEKLAIMSAMCGQSGNNGNQMNQLLPLMLFKDKFNTGDDTMKLVLMSSMVNPTADGGQMNQLLPLMFLKDADGGNDDKMKLLLMSSMMGNADGNNNPMMTYLLLETFMGKKDSNPVEATDE